MRLPAAAPLGVASLRPVAWLTCIVALAVGSDGCSSTEPPVQIDGIAPAEAFNNQPIDVAIGGGPFRPAYDIDTVRGRATTQLGAFSAVLSPTTGDGPRYAVDRLSWLSTSELAAELPQGVARGIYDIQVRDPRGIVGTLASAFTSLGPDVTSAVVDVLEPVVGAVVTEGAEVPVAVSADDDRGRLETMTWEVSDATGPLLAGACPLDPGVSKATCRFVFVAPPAKPQGALTISVSVLDAAGNPATVERRIIVALSPVVSGIAPTVGPERGGTSVVVTGREFVPGSEILLGGVPLSVAGGAFVDEHTLMARTPPHEPGTVRLSVRSGDAETAAGTFEFVGRPIVLAVSPTTGPLGGNIPVILAGRNFRDEGTGTTKIELGSPDGPRTNLACLQVVNANRITGILPAGAGAVTIYASDPIGGLSQLDTAFTYLGELQGDGGVAMPPCLKMEGP